MRSWMMAKGPFCMLLVACLVSPGCGQNGGKVKVSGKKPPNPASVPSAIPSDEECLVFGQAYEKAVVDGNVQAIAGMIDLETLLETVTANVDVSDRSRQEFIGGAKESMTGLGSQLVDIVQQGGSLQLLRIHELDNEKRAFFRLVQADGGLNYHDMVLAKNKRAKTRAVDIYIFTSSEKLTIYMAFPVKARTGSRWKHPCFCFPSV